MRDKYSVTIDGKYIPNHEFEKIKDRLFSEMQEEIERSKKTLTIPVFKHEIIITMH